MGASYGQSYYSTLIGTIPDISNGTMFCDLDWPLNASRGFVSIYWASSFLTNENIFTVTPHQPVKSFECTLSSRSEGVTSVPAVFCVCTGPTFSYSVTKFSLCRWLSLNLAAHSWLL